MTSRFSTSVRAGVRSVGALDDRVGGATLVTSQLPPDHWHEYIGDPTLADAILDRLLHNAHKIHLEGKESMRKQAASDHQQPPSKSKKN
jgi:DNA replication protein DnaC